MKLSAVVVTYNEEKNLDRCLKSLSFADEIIVVDSRSTDKTIQIAKKYTKKIINMDFDGFSSVKNAGINKARGSWLLSVDADEEITPELRDKIKETISSPKALNGYMIKRLTVFLGKIIRHSGWGTRDYQLRLFRKGAGKFEGRVHEALSIKGAMGRINGHMMHYSYPDIETYMRKMERYTSMQAADKKPFAALKMIFNPLIVFVKMYIVRLGFLDGFQGFMLAVLSGFSEFKKFSKMLVKSAPAAGNGIIVRMPNWVGDCVVATSYLPALKNKFKKVILLVKKGTEDVFRGNPHVDGMIMHDKRSFSGFSAVVSEIKRTGISTAVSLSPSLSSHLMLVLAGVKTRAGYSDDIGNILLTYSYKRDKTHKREHVIKEYGKVFSLLDLQFDSAKLKQELYIDLKEEKRFLKSSEFRIPGSAFVLAPFAGFGPSKTWPLEYYEELALSIIKKSKKNHVYITGGNDDGAGGIRQGLLQSRQFHDLRGIPLKDAFVLIKNAKFFIGNDSGLMHAADAFDTPLAVIFGSTAPFWGGPLSKNAKVIYKGIKCQPCFRKTCRYRHYRCLRDVSVKEVLKRINY